MNTTTAEPIPGNTRSLAQYCARIVNKEQRRRNGYYSSSPFRDMYVLERYRLDKGGWSSFKCYRGAETLLREIAESTQDRWLRSLVAKIDSSTGKGLRARISFNVHIDDEAREPNVITDGQRKHVYRAESKLRVHKLESFQNAESFINDVAAQEWWQERMGTLRDGCKPDRVTVTHKRGAEKADADWRLRNIRLPNNSWAWDKIVALHELAHLLAPCDEEHGPVFTACHVLLVREFVGDESADQLRASYLDNGCKIATDDTLESMFELRRTQGPMFTLDALKVSVHHVKRTRTRSATS